METGGVLIVWLLGASQIIGYGTLYYSFSILADDIARGFAWPVSWLYGSFSLALLAGGFVAPLVGRRIDRHGAGAVMTLGSALSAASLAGAALAPNAIAFTAALIAMQAVSAVVLYDAAFAALVQTTRREAMRRITHLTLIAGFASTLFWPLTSWLHGIVGWRQILIAFAALNLLVSMPIHAFIAARGHHKLPAPPGTTERKTADEPFAAPHTQQRWLRVVTIGFALSGFALSAVLAQMVPMLSALGLGTSALLVSTLFGPAQVLVRFVNMLIGDRRHPVGATLIGVGALPVALLILLFSAPMAAGAAAFAILLGFGSGLKSIVQGTLPLALFGSTAYGARLGYMASARQVATAVAPFALSLLIDRFGTTPALLTLAGTGLLSLVLFIGLAREVRLEAKPAPADVTLEDAR